MAKLFNGSINFPSTMKPTGAQPLDDRSVVKTLADLLSADTFGTALYNGMMVSVVDEQKVYMLVDKTKSTSEEGWVAVGSGNGSVAVETYAEAVELATSGNIGQVIYVKTKSSYDADGEGEGEAVEYDAAPYIVIGQGSLMKLAASTASGDIEGDVAELVTKVTNLEGTVGDENDGLVKDVADLTQAVSEINIPVKGVEVNDTNVVDENGIAKITLPDFETYAKADDVYTKSDADSTFVKSDGFNEFTEAMETKLDGIADGANVNVIEKIKVNDTELTVNNTDKSVNITIPSAPIQGIVESESVISIEDGGKLKTNLTLEYVKATDETNAVLRLRGANDVVVSYIDATDFIKDGMLENVSLEGPSSDETGTKYLSLVFNTISGKEKIRLDVSELLNYYYAGDGLNLSGGTFSIKLDGDNSYLNLTTNGISVSQTLIDKVTEMDNAVLSAATQHADSLNAAMDERVAKLEVYDHDSYAKADDVYTKTDADSTFVKSDGFNEFTEAMETKLDGIAAGAEENVIEQVKVNDIEASITEKVAEITIAAKDIELGVDIMNGEEVKYSGDTKVSAVLQSIQESIRGAIAGGVNSISSSDEAIVVNSADANNPVVTLNTEVSTEETLSNGHIEIVKGEKGIYAAMYYDGDDAE